MSFSEHFSNSELACKHCGINNCTPELVNALERFREAVGKPVLVDDAYRCAAHNAAVGGVPDSEHTLGIAADIKVPGLSARELYAIAVKIPGVNGLGVDDKRAYIHLDLRKVPARWCYDPETGQWCHWSDESLASKPIQLIPSL